MLLELDHICKIYGELHAVDDLNLTVPQGQWLAIVGSSGSGKTTLMNMIGCMDTPSKGSVKLEGRKLEDLNAKQLADVRKNMIGLVFQKFYLVPHLTAVENVMVAQYYHSVVDEKQALEALERVGLKDRAHHLPSQLSGGEQQRVCIARALINCPKIILADEPTGNLDEKNEKIVLDLFRQLHEQGTTIIVVTHDALVASCAQREIMLNHGVLVGEKWNDEVALKAYEAAGGKPAFTGSTAEGAQRGDTAIDFVDPTKSAKTGGSEDCLAVAGPVGSGKRYTENDMSRQDERKNMPSKQDAVKVVALTAAGLALLSACGEPKATPMNDEYAGNSGESEQSQEQQSQKSQQGSSGSDSSDGTVKNHADDSDSTTSEKKDTGNYADGTYKINGQYGPIGEDTIDVKLTVKQGSVEKVDIVGHPFTSISKKHQTEFANAINGVVDGKPLKGLKVDKVAGASWTSEAFNKALEVARQEASIQ